MKGLFKKSPAVCQRCGHSRQNHGRHGCRHRKICDCTDFGVLQADVAYEINAIRGRK